ncbi:peroxidase 43 [Tanacetum coccineum]
MQLLAYTLEPVSLTWFTPQPDANLTVVGFYNKVCPAAETFVANVVKDATKSDSQTSAVMLRLHFHDCFVEEQTIFSISSTMDSGCPSAKTKKIAYELPVICYVSSSISLRTAAAPEKKQIRYLIYDLT